MTQKDLDRVHEIDKEILSYIITLCTKHNIEYKLAYGSLLGAVRHKGIIPWDSDIDIAMNRFNYFKFLALAKNDLSSQYNLHVTYSSSSHGGMSEMKIGKKGTLFCAAGSENLNISKCVQVDIFLFDYIKNFWVHNKRFGSCILQTIKYASLPFDEKCLLSKSIWSRSKIVSFLLIPVLALLHFLSLILTSKGLQFIAFFLFVDKKKQSRFMGALSDGDMKYFCNSNDFEGIKLLTFEGKNVFGPSNPDHLLRHWYGDYWQLPPDEKRYFNGFDTWIFKENIPF